MKQLFVASVLTLVLFQPAIAEEDCEKSWNVYNLNGDDYLAGEEARKFRDDMQIRGIEVGTTRDGRISASQYNKACINNFWAKLEEQD